jgi:hypothetical protein
LPYISLPEKDRLPLTKDWNSIVKKELMPVTVEFKNTYKKVNIE